MYFKLRILKNEEFLMPAARPMQNPKIIRNIETPRAVSSVYFIPKSINTNSD